MAASTTSVYVGALVSPPGLRSPLALAKAAATVDQISGGRLILGLGAGWYQPEFVAASMPFLPHERRLAQIYETVAWYEEAVSDRLPSFVEGHPCVLIGADGDRSLPLGADIADFWVGQGPPARWAARNAALTELAAHSGRSGTDIVRAVDLEPAELDQLPQYRDAGLDLVIIVVPSDIPLRELDAALARAARLMV
jgi:alkanesulfonate monooxygenase SsuD/methylene tetrahydromethanopterin reductase-like flavin-dependent oxidoreductase (luciferase family)